MDISHELFCRFRASPKHLGVLLALAGDEIYGGVRPVSEYASFFKLSVDEVALVLNAWEAATGRSLTTVNQTVPARVTPAPKRVVSPDAESLSDLLRAGIEQAATDRGHKLRSHSRAAWAKDMDKLLRIDGFTVDEVRLVIEFALADDFWSSVIQSPSGIRKHWNKLALKAQKEQQQADPFDAARRVLAASKDKENDGRRKSIPSRLH